MKPTKARIELMQAISDGAVEERYASGEGYYSVWDKGPGAAAMGRRRQVVTARAMELYREELILPEPKTGLRIGIPPRLWELTPAGEAWLKANGGSTS